MKHRIRQTIYPGWIRAQLRTGDLIAFAGDDWFPSKFIRFFTWSKYSHVAKVLHTKGDRVYLMESTTTDTGNGKKISGVQRTLLSERIQDYNGRIDVYLMRQPIREKYDMAKAEAWALEMEGRPYDAWGAGLSGIGQWTRIPGRQRHGALMCSEFADGMDCAAGLVYERDRTPTPKEYVNRDLWQHEAFRVAGPI